MVYLGFHTGESSLQDPAGRWGLATKVITTRDKTRWVFCLQGWLCKGRTHPPGKNPKLFNIIYRPTNLKEGRENPAVG